MTIKPQLLLITCLIGFNLFSQQGDKSTDSLNLLFSFPCVSFEGERGIELDNYNNLYYTTSSTSDSIAKYDIDGALLETFIIPEVDNILDIAYDGEFFYGGINDTLLYVMDFDSKELILSLGMPIRIQSLTYNETDVTFWVAAGGSSIITQIDENGTQLGYVTVDEFDSINITGLAYDESISWNQYLWVFCQDTSRSLLFKYDIFENQIVGNEIDFTNLVSSDAVPGGLFDNIGIFEGFIGGLFQDELVFAFDLEYANQLVSTGENTIPSKLEIYPNPATDRITISASFYGNKPVLCRVINQYGKHIYECTLSSDCFEIDIRNYPKGNYFVNLVGSEGYSFTKKFIK